MEQRILNKEDEAGDGVIPLSLMMAHLSQWDILLPSLWKLIQILLNEPEKYHGCRLFHLLMNQAHTGISEYRVEIEAIIHKLHDVLYRQLTAWIVYGQCVDPDNEFFIVPYSSTHNTSSIAGWDKFYKLNEEQIPSHLSTTLADSILFIGKALVTVNKMDKVHGSLHTNDNDSLETITKSLRTFEHTRKIVIPEEMRNKHLQLLLQLHSCHKDTGGTSSPWIRYPHQLQQVIAEIRRSTAAWLFQQVLIGDHGIHRYLISFRQIFLLDYGDWATNFIEAFATWRRTSFARTLNGQKDKSRHRKSTEINKDPRVTSRNNNSIYHTTAKSTMIFKYQELNQLLTKASIGTDAEDQLNGYSIELDNELIKGYPFADILFAELPFILSYKLDWPIDLFLSPANIQTYSQLWTFLISLKETQMSLNNLWKVLRDEASYGSERNHKISRYLSNDNEDSHQERFVWHMRSIMLFWIDIFWNHIQTHVISSHFQVLMEMITPNGDKKANRRSFLPNDKLGFEEIQSSHEKFLNDVIRGCLLSSKECTKVIHDILIICRDFCDLMEHLSENGEWIGNKRRKTAKTAAEIVNQWTKSNDFTWLERVQEIEEKFSALSNTFFRLVSTQSPDVKVNGRVDILLMQLDYNKWFSKSYIHS
ncbi:gamma-tubulin complex component protein [Pilobolus umbonatus]|nr:gamma-tubulin complex component protein [Pilobolus umbonatus]